MTLMKTKFSIKRLALAIQWNVFNYGKEYINGTIGLGLGMSIYMCVHMHNHATRNALIAQNSGLSAEDYLLADAKPFLASVLLILVCCMAASVLTNVQDKLKRETFLMLPCSNMEKFVSRIMVSSVAPVIMFIAGLVIADVAQALFNLFFTPHVHISLLWTAAKAFINTISDGLISGIVVDNSPMPEITAWAFLIFMHSFYTLCGSIFRKKPIAFAWLITFGALTTFGLIVVYLAKNGYLDDFNLEMTNEDICRLAILCTTASLALAALNYWLSYKIFTRIQLIGNKWFNL